MSAPTVPATVLHLITAAARRGAELHAVALDEELRRRGHDSRVMALHAGPAELAVDALGPTSLSPATLVALRREADRAAVVVAHGSRTLPASVAALAGTDTPFVYRSIGDPDGWTTGSFARMRLGVSLRRAARVVALWPEARDRLVELHGLDRDRVEVVSNAVVASSAPVTPVPGGRRIAIVGSLSEEKRPQLALDVAHRLGAPLDVVGDGPLRAVLEQLARGRGQEVDFHGVVDDVTSVYDRADVLLLTSRTEGQPAVLIEAAQRGRPVVATAVGGVPAMVRDGVDGRLVDRDAAVEEIAAVVGAVLDDAARLGRAAATSLGRRGDIREAAAAWSRVVDRVATEGRSAGPTAV